MIYVFAALNSEILPLVKKYNLTFCSDEMLNFFKGENILVAVTGVRKINAAYAVGRTFALFPPTEDSVVINVGIAGGENIGKTYVINSIIDMDTTYCYYPDMIFDAGLDEITLRTYSDVVKEVGSDYIVDLEASGIFASCNKHISPDRMFFIKTVSDNDGAMLTPKEVSILMEGQLDAVSHLIDSFNNSESFVKDYSKYYKILNCSEYMRNEFNQLCRFGESLGIDYIGILDRIIASYGEVNTRKIGREVLNEFKRELTNL